MWEALLAFHICIARCPPKFLRRAITQRTVGPLAVILLPPGGQCNPHIVQGETLYRAYLVHYLEWVYAHTLPFAKPEIPVIRQIVHVDMEALTELTDTVAHCLHALGKEKEIPPFIDRVESVVPLEGFEKHATYLRALWLHIGLRDRLGALRELEKLGNILAYPRREAWELYLDVAGPDLTERQKITIAEQIVAEADEDENIRVQYAALRAIALVQIGETDAARKEFEALLENVKSPPRIQTSDELSTEWQIGKHNEINS